MAHATRRICALPGWRFTRCVIVTATEAVVASGCHRAELTAYCHRMLGSPFDAEDAVQETLLRAWRSSGRFEGRASVRTWLYRIATNVCLDALGRSARQPIPVEEVPETGVDLGRDSDPSDPSDRTLARETTRHAVLSAIGLLPPRLRAVLLLRDVLSWRAAEVADLLGTTTVAVNSALQRAHASLEEVHPENMIEARNAAERELLERYLAAFADDDIDTLVALVREGSAA
ncbi:MAG TPA: sigma-70 family RNA polymerase sigma factor [Solirubrobacteraceae bacterium]|nr:sigma-70 family RNA polymerase sigma factor [Solirubrobacteraceae bacterium]